MSVCRGRVARGAQPAKTRSVQPLQRIERRQDCPLLLSRQIRDMLACQHETAIDSAEVAVMQAPRIVTSSGRLSSSSTLAMLMAIRRASSRVCRLASYRNEAGAGRLI